MLNGGTVRRKVAFSMRRLVPILLMAACGGSVPSNSEHPDAKPPVTADASLCAAQDIDPSYATLDGSAGTATIATGGADVYQLHLNSDPMPDVLSVELFAGFGVFNGGAVTPGTYDLSTETSFGTCGACVLIYGNENLACTNQNNDCSSSYYMPTSGSLTLSMVSGRLAGSLSDVHFQHVAIDFNHKNSAGMNDYPTTPVGDMCDSWVQSVSFDRPYNSSSTADAGTTD
jgi:hypothetical protein